MIKNKLAVLGMAGIMVGGMSTSVFAEDGTKAVQVSYDNSSEIVDPEKPINPEWAVTIPSAIVFTDDNKQIDTTVNLIAKENSAGGLHDIAAVSVDVTVESTNAYKLQLKGATPDPVEYQLSYGDTLMTNTAKKVATLKGATEADKTKVGKAVMTGTAKKNGNHIDTLTYTVAKTVAQ